MILTFEPSALQTENLIIGKDTFTHFVSSGVGTTTIIGNPALPVFQQQIICSSISLEKIEVLSSSSESIYLNHKLIPFNLPKTRENTGVQNIISIDSLAYSTDKLLPEVFYEKGSVYMYSGLPQFDFRFYPVQYNPKTGQVVIIKKAVLKLTFKNQAQKSLSANRPNLYNNQLLNGNAFKLAGNTGSDAIPPTLLIVTHESLYNQAKEFADWKMRMGIKTSILKTSDISLNPDAEQIKTRITQIHDTFGFDNLLIIGNVSLVPAFYGVDNSLNDHTYSTIQGTDYLPDISVGRFPVDSEDDSKIELRKSMNYERFPDISSGNDWFKKSTVAASNDYLDNSNGISMRNFFQYADFDTVDDFRYLTGKFNADNLQKSFTYGRSWMFYIGHGTSTTWTVIGKYSTQNLSSLYNNNMLPVIVSVACETANLDYPTECLGKKWMSLAEKRGAVSFIGATELTEFFYSDTLGKHSIYGYFNRSALTIGAALNYGKMQMYNSFLGGQGSVTEKTMQQFLLLGDPTLMPWTNIPSVIHANYKKQLKPVPQVIKFTVTSNGDSIRNALVCLSTNDFSFYQTTYTDSVGYVSFEVNPDVNTKYYLTISGYNLVTFEDSITFDTNEQPYNSIISVFPIPIRDFCTVSSITTNKQISSVVIMDIRGRIVAYYNNINSNTFVFNRNELLTGIYILRITDSTGKAQIKRVAVM